MDFNFALRNVLRNKKRSFLTALSILVAGIVVCFAQSWVTGLLDVYVRNSADYQTGHIRLTTNGFLDRERFFPVDEVMTDAEAIRTGIQSLPEIEGVEERIRFGILLGHGDATVEAVGLGIDLRRSRLGLPRKLSEGRLEESGIYVGTVLAKKLGVRVGDDLLLATKTTEGGLNGIKLKVAGIAHLGISVYDRKFFYLSLADAKRLLKIRQGTTEMLVFVKRIDRTDEAAAQVRALLPEGITAATYKAQLGNFYEVLKSTRIIYLFMEALILFLASFVIINTMMMAIFERLREIGTLKALGLTNRELFVNFTLEGAIVGAAGGIVGTLLGFVLIAVLNHTGINMQAAFQNVDMPLEYIIRPPVRLSQLAVAMGLTLLMPTLAAMIPARYAMKLTPAESLRK